MGFMVGGPRLHDIFALRIVSYLESTDEIIRKYKKSNISARQQCMGRLYYASRYEHTVFVCLSPLTL